MFPLWCLLLSQSASVDGFLYISFKQMFETNVIKINLGCDTNNNQFETHAKSQSLFENCHLCCPDPRRRADLQTLRCLGHSRQPLPWLCLMDRYTGMNPNSMMSDLVHGVLACCLVTICDSVACSLLFFTG